MYEYIATDSPAAAEEVVTAIHRHAELLAEFPYMGFRYEQSVRHVRILIHGVYRIAYLVKDEEHVEILGVFHGALEIDRHLW
ncbi:MAG: type II toxin-antitoxin system RelE/ParE family toxin [Thermodesulfobacteriota bacterium]